MTGAVTENELLARNTGLRVTLEDVNNAIIAEHYFTAADGVFGNAIANGQGSGNLTNSLGLLTFCVLTLKNGFTVTGQSACADPNNYKQDIGERIARQDAVNKIWPLLGYELRTRIIDLLENALAQPITDGSDGEQEELFEGVGVLELPVAPDTSWLDRLMEERHQLANRLQALDGFVQGNAFYYSLPEREQSDLQEQASFMRGYLAILDRRLARAHGHYGKFQSGFGTFAAE